MIPSIITPMNFTYIRDAICQHIATCRDSQILIAQNAGLTENDIEQNIDFTVFPKRFRYPDVSEMPCVFVYFNEMTFPDDEQDIYENAAAAILQVEYYTVGTTETDEDGDTVIADANAEDRLNYFTAQLYKILCSEETNIYKATQNVVKNWRLRSWKRTTTPDADNTVGTVLGAVFEFEVGFEEPTYYTQTYKLEELYTRSHIQDEYISPFVRVLLDS